MKNNHNSLLKGYRLHDARIAYSGGIGSMRSIKYELIDPQGVYDLRDEIAQKVATDYKYLYGNINLNDYLDYRSAYGDKKDPRGPSFLGLWIKALSLGFVFSKQSHLIPDFQKLIGAKTQSKMAYEQLSNDWQEIIPADKWDEWWKSTGRPAKLENVFEKESLKLSKVREVVEKYNQNQELKRDTEFRCQLFGIDPQKVPSTQVSLEKGVSWACLPGFPAEEMSQYEDKTELIDKIVDYYIENHKLDAKKDGELSHFFALYGLNQGYMYGFLGNFFDYLKNHDLEKHAQNLSEVFGFDEKQKQIVVQRLQQLHQYCNDIPNSPKLIDSWSKYCNDFGGTLESWYSNRKAKQETAIAQIKTLMELLTKIKEAVSEDEQAPIESLTDIQEYIINNNLENKIYHQQSQKLESYLAQLREELNNWQQKYPENAQILNHLTLTIENKKTNAKQKTELKRVDWQKELKEKIQNSPLLFGESKFILYDEIYNLKSSIRKNAKRLIAIGEACDNNDSFEFSDEKYDSLVDKLAMLYNRIFMTMGDSGEQQLIGAKEVGERLKKIAELLETDFAKRDDFNRYFNSSYSRRKVNLLPYRKIELEKLIKTADLLPLYKIMSDKLNEPYFLRDVTQISKIILSACIYHHSHKEQREIVTVHSELQGYASLLSRQKFVSRYIIQATNGSQCLPAVLDDISKKGEKVERYGYVFWGTDEEKKVEIKRIANSTELPAHNPEQIIEVSEEDKMQTTLVVHSSKYQIQFLDWFFGRNKSRQNKLEMGGAFTIAEYNAEIDWSDEYPRQKTDEQKRLFIAQPFTIAPPQKSTVTPQVEENKYIGVDIGEYGLAWSLIEVEEDKVKEIESGFIADPQQRILQKAVNEWRQGQVRQTFSSPDTYVARLRDSLIGAYRNQLEALSLHYHARLSFEYEVSAFETGGNKIKKVYDSIKKGVIDKMENNTEKLMSWGKNPFGKSAQPKLYEAFKKIYGFETTAAGTSQFCTKCKRWSSLAINPDQKYKIVEMDRDKLLVAEIDNSRVRFLGRLNDKVGGIISGKDLRSQIYKAMRPNIDGLGMQIVKRSNINFIELEKIFGQGKRRGNIGIYVCPYQDCHHIADADLQASFNIAVRGYLKDRANKKQKTDKKDSLTKEVLCEQEAQLEFKPIGLDLKKSQY